MKKYLFSFLLLGSIVSMISCGGSDDDGSSNTTNSNASFSINGKKVESISKAYTVKVGAGMRGYSDIIITYVDENNQMKEVHLSQDQWSIVTGSAGIDKADIAMSVKFSPGTRACIDNDQYYNIDYNVEMNYVVTYEDGTTANIPVVNIDPCTEEVQGKYIDEALEAASMSATNSRDVDTSVNQIVMGDYFQSNSTPNVQKPNNQVDPTTMENVTYRSEEQFIDLDLPSGLLWANRNVGAQSPYEVGGLYGWGDATGYQTSTNPNYYYTSSPKITDIQATRYDLACTVNPNWMMPTRDQFTEMVTNTNHEVTEINGVRGVWFISKKNKSHKMFLPMNNFRNGTNLNSGYSENRYWTSTIDTSDKSRAWTFWMQKSGNLYHPGKGDKSISAMSNTGFQRYYGCSIRAVKNPNPRIIIN